MALQWFKLYGLEYLSDPKISSLTAQERSCWLTLLCLASVSTTIGTIEFLDVSSLLEKSGIKWDPYHPEEWDAAKAVLTKFERLKMIVLNDDGSIVLKNWNKRQEHNLTVAERVAKTRLKQKNVTMNVTSVTPNKIRLDKIRIDKDILSTSKDEVAVSLFEEFWKLYPKKELKKRSQEIWSRKRLDSRFEEISRFIEKALQTDRWKNGFVKQPPAFLNGECWNDDLSSYQSKTNSRGKTMAVIQ